MFEVKPFVFRGIKALSGLTLISDRPVTPNPNPDGEKPGDPKPLPEPSVSTGLNK